MLDQNIVHVAVAVIKNSHGQYFIAKRPKTTHQGGLWEFPGGKIENNETVLDALKRELLEEVGIKFHQAFPLIKIQHNYPDKSVLLDVWCVSDFSGTAFGKEGQETCWINQDEFSLYKFPAANLPIINSILLPDECMITGEFKNEEELFLRIKFGLKKGIKLLQFRAHHLSDTEYFDCAKNIYALCEKNNTTLLLNTSVINYKKHKANSFSDGLHLTAKEMESFHLNEIGDQLLISTSAHNEKELLMAEEKNISFVMLSPVKKTRSHPEVSPIGWKNFKNLVDKVNIPVYALGGMKQQDLKESKINGAQGIAGIGEFWSE